MGNSRPAPLRVRLRARLMALARPREVEALPVVFDRRRVYVLPTRFGLFYATLLLVMIVGALNYNNNPALLLALLLAGAGLASLVATHLQLSGIRVLAIDAEPVAAGAPLHVRLHVGADPRRPRRGLWMDDNGALELAPAVFHLDHGHGEVHLSLATEHRGWRDLPRLRISTIRPLGMARAWSYLWPQAPLLVYPAPEPYGPPLPPGSGNQLQTRLHPSGDDVHHLRGYRAGDARRAIAWKPSARRDTLLVREYEQPLGADVVLDWNGLGGLAFEARIARLARWVDEAEHDGRRYRLSLPGHAPLGPGHGAPHHHACLRALALLPHG